MGLAQSQDMLDSKYQALNHIENGFALLEQLLEGDKHYGMILTVRDRAITRKAIEDLKKIHWDVLAQVTIPSIDERLINED